MPHIYANGIGDRLKTWTKHRQDTPNPSSKHGPSKMDKPVFSFEHETKYPDPGSDVFAIIPCYHASRPPPADNVTLDFSNFGVLGDLDNAAQPKKGISNASMQRNLKCNLSSSKRARTQSTGKLSPNSVASTHRKRWPLSVRFERRTHSIAVQSPTADFVLANMGSAISGAA